MTDAIEITINGSSEQIAEAATLDQVIELLGEGTIHLLVELNGRYIYPSAWAATRIAAGDRLEIIHPLFGG